MVKVIWILTLGCLLNSAPLWAARVKTSLKVCTQDFAQLEDKRDFLPVEKTPGSINSNLSKTIILGDLGLLGARSNEKLSSMSGEIAALATDEEPLILVDAESGRPLKTLTDISAETIKYFRAKKLAVLSIEPTKLTLMKNNAVVYFPVALSDADTRIVAYDYATGLIKDYKVDFDWQINVFAQRMEIQHERFLNISHSYNSDPGTHELIDLTTNKRLLFKSDQWTTLKISSDGKTLLVTRRFSNEGKWDEKSKVIRLPQWSKKPNIAIDLSPSASPEEIHGVVLGYSDALDKFIVDEAGGDAHGRGWGMPYQLPQLKVVTYKNNEFKTSDLPGWSALSTKIELAAQKGVVIPYQALTGQMTPDGKFFMLHANFHSQGSMQEAPNWSRAFEVSNDLVATWSLDSKQEPLVITSKDLDSYEGNEPTLKDQRDAYLRRGHLSRAFAVRLLDNGQVIMARGSLEDLKRTRLDIKIGAVTPTTDGSLSWAVKQDEMLINKNNSIHYLRGIQISPDGKRLLFQITNTGVISVRLPFQS